MKQYNPDVLIDTKIAKWNLEGMIDSIVFQDETGYQLFGKYTIIKKHEDYNVSKIHTDTLKKFGTLRNAVTWVTFDKRNLIVEANRVIELDKILTGTEFSMKVHEQLSKKAKSMDDKLIYLAKLKEDKLKRKQVLEELSEYVTNIKNWQLKKFKEQASK